MPAIRRYVSNFRANGETHGVNFPLFNWWTTTSVAIFSRDEITKTKEFATPPILFKMYIFTFKCLKF